ncbi:hypothetical protein VTJ49DRAFT_611 [Mycothermus thermophilus]|uniref:WD repeat-containing protein n=1 Tax=Humicola insolens TaxID=85995 RepID=A0ABR3VNZ0_HUMIN
MQSSNPEHFFETDAELEKKRRRAAKAGNKFGNPIPLNSKILAAIPDPRSPSSRIFVAEASGVVRLVDIDNPEKPTTTYRGPTAPVCCIAVGGPNNGTLFAGSWDKAIWAWDLATRAVKKKYLGHSDFVKAVACAKVGGKHVLISGGADKKIVVRDVETELPIHIMQDTTVNMLSVQDLLVDHVASTPDEVVVISASSDPHIRRWKIQLKDWDLVDETATAPEEEAAGSTTAGTGRSAIREHETTVYRLTLHGDDEFANLWTASGDGTAKCLSRARGFACEETLEHGGHVRAVAVTEQWVVTAGRDEDVKFWDRASGKLHCALQGHYDEVTALVVLGQRRICSVGIDGTVRTWPLDKAGLDAAVAEQVKPPAEEEEANKTQEGLLSPEEEAELAALMEDESE